MLIFRLKLNTFSGLPLLPTSQVTLFETHLDYCLFIFIDLDVILTRLFGLKLSESHRTWSHSLYCSIIYIPIITMITCGILDIGIVHAFLLSSLCFLSHLYTDWITSYGTSLFWPLDRRMLTLGVITIFDLPSLIIWYVHFYLSATNTVHPLYALISFFVTLSIFLYWKRLLLLDVYEKADIKENGTPVRWLIPSNIIPNKYYILSWHPNEKEVKLDDIGYGGLPSASSKKERNFYACVAPRESFYYLQRNTKYLRIMVIDMIPSSLLILIHAYWFFNFI